MSLWFDSLKEENAIMLSAGKTIDGPGNHHVK